MPFSQKAFVIPNRASGEESAVLSPRTKKQIPRSLSPRLARLRAARNDNNLDKVAES
jgi:hypothetical protein